MSACVDLVAGQLSAVWTSDWAALRQTLCSDPELQISHGDWSHSEWEIGNFYRYISQAWDFMPGAVELSDEGDGIVQAKMRLTNGGGWAKDIEGEYRVRGDRIDRLRIIDRGAVRLTDGLNP